MEETKTLIYDGSFNGFLTAIFCAFEEPKSSIIIQKKETNTTTLFTNTSIIFTDMPKAEQVWNTIQNKNNAAIKKVYFAFLSGTKNIENQLYLFIKNLFNPYIASQLGYCSSLAIKIDNLAQRVSKEKKYLEESLELTPSKDGIYFSNITPENDILPLLTKYFRLKYHNQSWLIFDAKRNYGMYYNQFCVEIVTLDTKAMYRTGIAPNSSIKNLTNTRINKINKHFTLNNLKPLLFNKLHKTKKEEKFRESTLGRLAV